MRLDDPEFMALSVIDVDESLLCSNTAYFFAAMEWLQELIDRFFLNIHVSDL